VYTEVDRREGINIIPFGLDLLEKLIELAKKRLLEYAGNFYVGNA